VLPYQLSAVSADISSHERVAHSLASRSPSRFVRRVAEVLWETGTAAFLDLFAPQQPEIFEASDGQAPPTCSLALYLHWSPDGRISPMVRRQVRLWREAGFACVFITNAAPPAEDWAAIAADAVLRIRRANIGRDFGAWRDAAAFALQRFGTPQELLLTNDSILGPFLPLSPLLDAWRARGHGYFGLTESLGGAAHLGGGAHLQSYALLGRGEKAVAEMLGNLAALKDSRSKWQVVRRGEIGLTQRMVRAGVPCWALFGQERLAALASTATRERIAPRYSSAEAFARVPFNPCHHLWRELVEGMGYPYLKTELIRRNPGKLPGVENWREVVPAAELPMIEEHLAMIGP
jgi:lipopolysaccharide biosynthesis protein